MKNEVIGKKEKGITLVALVVTIIVLLILAAVSINIFFTDNGLFSRAFEAKKWHEIGEIQEKLELEKEPVFIDNQGKITIEEYLEHIIEEGIIEEKDIEDTEEEKSKYITVEDKYVFLVEEEEDGNIKITYEGEVRNFKPGLEIEITKVTTNSITVKANGRRMANGEYSYYIKDIVSGEEYELKKTQKEDEYIFEGLEQNKEYKIKVVAKNKYGEAVKESENIRTIELESLQTANITFTYNPNGWTNGNVEVTANVSQSLQEGTRIQTSKDGIEWSDDASQTFEANGNIYVRIYDGVNESNYGVGQVTKIDKEKPIVTAATPSTTTIAITATDNLSGIIGYTVTTSASTPSSFTAVTNTKSLSVTKTGLSQATTYYVWVKDAAGNVSAYKQATTTKQLVTGISLSKTSTTLNNGSAETITATVTPTNAYNKNITWTTSNSGIATVSAGRITAKGPGTATITATAADGSGRKATCTVTVRQLVTGISLSKSSTTIYVGDAETITATISPSNASNKGVTWTTSNSSIATVSAGRITAKAVGTATITATAADGSGRKATCTVTTKAKSASVSFNLQKYNNEETNGGNGDSHYTVSVSGRSLNINMTMTGWRTVTLKSISTSSISMSRYSKAIFNISVTGNGNGESQEITCGVGSSQGGYTKSASYGVGGTQTNTANVTVDISSFSSGYLYVTHKFAVNDTQSIAVRNKTCTVNSVTLTN